MITQIESEKSLPSFQNKVKIYSRDVKLGMRFGRLIALLQIEKDSKGNTQWLCRCDCGTEKIVKGHNLASENTKSCGICVKPVSDRFWNYVEKNESGGCWVWGGCISLGYGVMLANGKDTLAHRISWEIHNGPIPEGLCVLHKCDNPPCTNPDHLFLGTRADNTADKVSKGRQAMGEKFPQSKLTDEKVKDIRILYATGVRTSKLAKQFGVDPWTIIKAVRRRTWKHVT